MKDIIKERIVSPVETDFVYHTLNNGSPTTLPFRVRVTLDAYDVPSDKNQKVYLNRFLTQNNVFAGSEIDEVVEKANAYLNNHHVLTYGKHVTINITCPSNQEEHDTFLKIQKQNLENKEHGYKYVHCINPPNPRYPDYNCTVNVRFKGDLEFAEYLKSYLPEDAIYSKAFNRQLAYMKKTNHEFYWDFVLTLRNEEDFISLTFLPTDKIQIQKVSIKI